MKLIINNEKKTFSEELSLEQLLKEIHLFEQKGFAVAVNEQVIYRGNWSTFTLKENDNILIIQATQGG